MVVSDPSRSEAPARRFYRGLLGLSVATLLIQALPGPLVRGLWLGYLALTAFLCFGLPRAGRGHRTLGILCILAELLWLAGAPHHPLTGILLLLAVTLFIGRSLRGLILCLAAERRVGGAAVAGATAGYLLLGLSGGMLLTVLAGLQPGGFRDSVSGQAVSLPPIASLAQASLDWDHHFQQITYFAFVSLTTVGYGDITPSRPLLQLASVSLSVLGPLYMAVVLGVLISRIDPLNLRPPASPRQPDRSHAPERRGPGPGGSAG